MRNFYLKRKSIHSLDSSLIFRLFFVAFVGLTINACAFSAKVLDKQHFDKQHNQQDWAKYKEVRFDKPVLLRLKSHKDSKQLAQVYSQAVIKNSSIGGYPLVEDVIREKVMSFLVETQDVVEEEGVVGEEGVVETQGVVSQKDSPQPPVTQPPMAQSPAAQPLTAQPQVVQQRVRVIEKNGLDDLHDYGYPRMGEVFTFHYKPNGEVIKVEDFPKNSLFYVPSIYLPNYAAVKGDTWVLKKSWISQSTGVELELNLLTILKKFVRCRTGETCALLSFFGETIIPSLEGRRDSHFLGKLQGALLFSLERGLVMAVDSNSQEILQSGLNMVEVNSCLKSAMLSEKTNSLSKKVSCQVSAPK